MEARAKLADHISVNMTNFKSVEKDRLAHVNHGYVQQKYLEENVKNTFGETKVKNMLDLK
jgi:hypothetical protein